VEKAFENQGSVGSNLFFIDCSI